MEVQSLSPSSCSVSSESGRDRNQPVRTDPSLAGSGGGEEARRWAGAGIPEEESWGERGGEEEGSRSWGGKEGEETRLWRPLVHRHQQHSVSEKINRYSCTESFGDAAIPNCSETRFHFLLTSLLIRMIMLNKSGLKQQNIQVSETAKIRRKREKRDKYVCCVD